jgi:hypothetical protein
MRSPAFTRTASLLARAGALSVLAAAALLLTVNACNQGAEGDRCNPDLAMGESDCGGSLTCKQPVNCPESYCCPTEGAITSAFCQPGCAGGQASICDAGGDADCASLGGGG